MSIRIWKSLSVFVTLPNRYLPTKAQDWQSGVTLHRKPFGGEARSQCQLHTMAAIPKDSSITYLWVINITPLNTICTSDCCSDWTAPQNGVSLDSWV